MMKLKIALATLIASAALVSLAAAHSCEGHGKKSDSGCRSELKASKSCCGSEVKARKSKCGSEAKGKCGSEAKQAKCGGDKAAVEAAVEAEVAE